MRRMVLGGIVGQTRLPSGSQSEFFVYLYDVASIAFK